MSGESPTPPAEPRPPATSRLLRATAVVETGLLVGLLGTMIGLAALQIVLRNLFQSGLLWADPLLRVMVLWVGMLGAVAATRDDRQITVDVLSRFLPARWKAASRVLTDLFAATLCAVLARHALRLVLDERAAATVAFGRVPLWVCESVLPAAFAVIALRYLTLAAVHARQAASRGAMP